jgi:hypothetical protein
MKTLIIILSFVLPALIASELLADLVVWFFYNWM